MFGFFRKSASSSAAASSPAPETPKRKGLFALFSGGEKDDPKTTRRTEVKNNTLEPVWNSTLSWDMVHRSDTLDILVFDKDFDGDDLLGKTTVAMANVFSSERKTFSGELPLLTPQGKEGGTIRLDIWILPFF